MMTPCPEPKTLHPSPTCPLRLPPHRRLSYRDAVPWLAQRLGPNPGPGRERGIVQVTQSGNNGDKKRVDLKIVSRELTEGASRAPARSYLHAVGITNEDLDTKPLIVIASTWNEFSPCQANLKHVADQVKQGIRAAGGVPIEFTTISVTDGIAMGTEGMKASLISRDLIADSIELAVFGHRL